MPELSIQANILVDSDLRARLADFDRARIIDDDALENQTKPSTGLERESWVGDVGDSIHWSAPEIMRPDRFGFTKNSFAKLPSKSTDIYALGMTILEVGDGSQPYFFLKVSYPLPVSTGAHRGIPIWKIHG